MTYKKLLRILPFVGLIIVSILFLLLSACAQEQVAVETKNESHDTLEVVLQEELEKTAPAKEATMGRIDVKILAQGAVSTKLGLNRAALYFRDIVLIRADGTKVRCMVTIVEAFEPGIPESVTQTCESFTGEE